MSSQVKVLLTAEDRTAAALRSASSGLDKYSATAGLAQTALAGVMAAVSIGVIAAAARSTIDYADEMGKLALKAGTTTEAISGLAYAASLSDVDNKQLAKGLRELGNDAQTGGEKLASFGVDLRDASGKAKTTEALFSEVADRLSAIEDPAKRAAWASELFGDKIGPELLPLLISGSAGIKGMTDEAARFSRVVSEEAAASAAQFNDNLVRISAGAQSAGRAIVGTFTPSLADLTEALITASKHSTGLLDTLRMFGSTTYSIKGFDLGKDIAASRDSIDSLTQARARYVRANSDTSGIDQALASAKRKLTYLQDLERQAQLADNKLLDSKFGKDSAKLASLRARNGTFIPDLPTKQEATKRPEKTKTTGEVKPTDPMADFIGGPQVQASMDRSDAMARQAKQLYEQTRTPLEELAATESDLQRMRDLGYLQEETYWRAREAAIDKYDATLEKTTEKVIQGTDVAAEQAKRLGDAFANTFDDAFRNGTSLGDLLKKLAYDAINIQFLTPATQAIGSAMGAVASSIFSFDGGGYTGSGDRTGGLDGKGGFMAVLHPNETVLDHSKGQGGSGGTTIVQSITVDARGADAGVEARIRAAMAQTKAETLAAVQTNANRGGSFAKAVGRG